MEITWEELAKLSLLTYFEVDKKTKAGVVEPYDDYIIEYLGAHTTDEDMDTNYLDMLNSKRSFGECYRYARYLALAIKGEFNLHIGNLSGVYGGRFPHAWIETKDYVYDVGFIGKWPKKTYYDLFKPIDIESIDLMDDQKFFYHLKHNREAINKPKMPFLKYVGWYDYTDAILNGNQVEMPEFFYFPQDEEKIKEYEGTIRE